MTELIARVEVGDFDTWLRVHRRSTGQSIGILTIPIPYLL